MDKEETQKTTFDTNTYGENVKITDKDIAKLDSEAEKKENIRSKFKDGATIDITRMDKDEEKTKELRDIVDLSTIKSSKEKPAANSLTKQRIKKLFRMFCVHYELGMLGAHPKESHSNCSKCILRDIPWKTSEGQTKDLCYAIWHEDVLKDI